VCAGIITTGDVARILQGGVEIERRLVATVGQLLFDQLRKAHQQVEHRVRGSRAQAAEAGALHQGAELFHLGDIIVRGVTVDELFNQVLQQ